VNCAEVRALTSDWLDDLLSEPQLNIFQTHLESCTSCKRYTTEMQQILSVLCSVREPDAAPPPDFTNRVMSRLRQEEVATRERRFLRLPLKSLAMAASLLFLLGMNNLVVSNYLAGRFVDPTPVSESPAPSVPVIDGNVAETPAPEPVETEPKVAEVPVEPTEPDEPNDAFVAVVSEDPVQEIVEVIEPVESDPVVTNEAPVKEEPIVVAEVPKRIPRTVVLSSVDLPDPEIFISQKRITEGTMVKVYVPQLEEASKILASNASLHGLTPTVEYTMLNTDGRLIRVYRYEVPFAQANQFANSAYTLGKVITEQRIKDDITSDYALKLAHYQQLVEQSMAARGEESEQLNQSINALVEDLSRMDKSAKEMQSIIVWLES